MTHEDYETAWHSLQEMEEDLDKIAAALDGDEGTALARSMADNCLTLRRCIEEEHFEEDLLP